MSDAPDAQPSRNGAEPLPATRSSLAAGLTADVGVTRDDWAPGVCLVILDGFGLAPDGPGNAVSLARTPTFDGLWARYPHAQLTACGPAVGLPEGQMGNSEVGHLNLGAGAVVKQDLARIDDAVADGSIREVAAIREALERVAEAGRAGEEGDRLHLIGLVSDGGVHSSMEHLKALIDAAAAAGVRDVVVHAFSDGRDTLPTAGAGYLETVEGWCAEASEEASGRRVRVGSVIGRYFAMDRDSRWERIQQAYDLLVHGEAPHRASTAVQAVREAYERDETDEFVTATAVGDEATIRPGDTVLVFNFRPDRVREITRALAGVGGIADMEVDRQAAAPHPEQVDPALPPVAADRYVCMTEYKADWPYPIAFPPRNPEVTLADVIEATGGAQIHVAETEKYPHVTYFFNGGIEAEHRDEFRDVVPSPRDVATYDLKPQMSAREAADAFVRLWREHGPTFGIINFANPDMVGHTGVIPAAVRAIEVVDGCLADVVAAVTESGGVCLVTADHGNADNMLEPDGSPNTAHSLNPVPFVVTREGLTLRDEGILADVAPTVLDLLGVVQPEAMTGRSMIVS
ncbi:2,3-bisphosphoglycerate-independent phosphoglycerate mutase [Patulibacter defluvii]|uniref:2,3-bisphosphoglycerate-independent phosphoglycerate mutase n=1 Tax=Patulibacter defluvii TaxID=3095358 RepID=UPI002A765B54|nr:2,3-bisphosphoglycerate-independent phosphoglycerate mutase [Patulibacter sp. DM4]